MCLPSLKQDHKMLMLFLPHILLHSLLEGNNNDQQKAYDEMLAVIGSFKSKEKVENNLLNVSILFLAFSFSDCELRIEQYFSLFNQCRYLIFHLPADLLILV